jgi:hypothetical protein
MKKAIDIPRRPTCWIPLQIAARGSNSASRAPYCAPVPGADLAALRDGLRHSRSLPARPFNTPDLDRSFVEMLEMALVAAVFRGNSATIPVDPIRFNAAATVYILKLAINSSTRWLIALKHTVHGVELKFCHSPP